MLFVDTAALTIEVLRKAGLRAELEPASDDRAETPLVLVQDAGPTPLRSGPQGAATVSLISLSVVARSRAECARATDEALAALVQGHGSYTNGRLIKGFATNLPRPVAQIVLAGDNLYQRHAMVKIIAGHPTL